MSIVGRDRSVDLLAVVANLLQPERGEQEKRYLNRYTGRRQ